MINLDFGIYSTTQAKSLSCVIAFILVIFSGGISSLIDINTFGDLIIFLWMIPYFD